MSAIEFTDDKTRDTSTSGTLSDGQEILIALSSIIPTILSLIGSSTIVYMVIRTSKKKQLTPYKRLLFGMSIFDILCSWIIPFWMLLLPKETSHRIWALGNDVTCTVLGFFIQITNSALLYNGMISYYFVLTVRFGYKEETIAKWIEPIMHFIAIVYPFTCATVGAILGVYHEAELVSVCWVNDYPDNCGDGPGQSGEKCLGPVIAYLFAGIITFLTLISLLINNALIYCFVRKTILQTSSRQPVSETVPSNASSNLTIQNMISGSVKSRNTIKIGIQDENQKRRVQLVATQAFLYVGAFFLCYSWTILLTILAQMGFDDNDEKTLFPLLLIQSIMYPFQGFFNLLIYIRPNYIRYRKSYPNESKVWVIHLSIFGEDNMRPSSTDTTGSGRTS